MLNELAKKIHDNAVNKGFYDCSCCWGTGFNSMQEGSDLCSECGATGKNNKKNIGELLMLVVSELGEALDADRKGKYSNFFMYDQFCEDVETDFSSLSFEDNIKDTFEDEIADSIIRLLDMSAYLGIDIQKHVELKMKYNASRPHKHGKKY